MRAQLLDFDTIRKIYRGVATALLVLSFLYVDCSVATDRKIYVARADDIEATVVDAIVASLKQSLPVVQVAKTLSAKELHQKNWEWELINTAQSLRRDTKADVYAKAGVTAQQIDGRDWAALERLFHFVKEWPGAEIRPAQLKEYLLNRSISIPASLAEMRRLYSDEMKKPDYGALLLVTSSDLRWTSAGVGNYSEKTGWGEIGTGLAIISPYRQKHAQLFSKMPDVPSLVALAVASVGWGFNINECDNRFQKQRSSWALEWSLLTTEPKQPTATCVARLKSEMANVKR